MIVWGINRTPIIRSRRTYASGGPVESTIIFSTKNSILSKLEFLAYSIGLVILVTSLIDLFMTRILFRTGPDALSGMDAGSTFFLAVVGRINLTLEQFLLFAFLVLVSALLLQENREALRITGLVLIAIVISSASLYMPLAAPSSWAASVFLLILCAILVPMLIFQYASTQLHVPRSLRVTVLVFAVCLTFSFEFPLYYRMYYLLGSISLTSLPYPLEAYLLGVFAVMATSLVAFAYAVQAPSEGFGFGPRNVLKTLALPTLLVAPMLYAFVTSFFAVQIFGMVLTMSTDFSMSHDVIRALVLVFWFLLTAILLLLFKGRQSDNRSLTQQAIGLVFLLSTTMLFNYPYYLMLGIAGVIMICYPLKGVDRTIRPTL